MKRKKWSEQEEETLLSKYSDLLNSGTLSKLKTREKKFKPIAEHVNSIHHLQDSLTFPFRWSWRDVSIKVQNMRHQYLGVKQKIRISDDNFNWKDGENHWQNFMKYKEVFGDVPLDVKGKRNISVNNGDLGFEDCGDLGFGVEVDSDELEEEEEEEENEEEEDEEGQREGEEKEREEDDHYDNNGGCEAGEEDEIVGKEAKVGGESEFGEMSFSAREKLNKGLSVNKRFGIVGMKVLELREMGMRREERRRENEFRREKVDLCREEKRKEIEFMKEKRLREKEELLENKEMELEERELKWARMEMDTRLRLERDIDEERMKRMRMEEKREEEEMEWRERIVELQIEHEKQMMQMHDEACQNQLQLFGVVARLLCQFFGSPNDGLGGGLGALPAQVLQNLQHPGGLGDNGKPDENSPSEFL